MSKLLTISVAAYNVEQYLEKLLDTIIESECINKIEVLVINDGSKDGTTEIAQKYHNKFPDSVFLIDKGNGGHGSTINKGMELATGKYFKVIDGDDWVDPIGLRSLVEKLENEDSDVIVCNFQECYETGEKINKTYPMFETGMQNRFSDVCKRVERILFHAIFFKTKILQENKIKIDEHCFYVDAEYVLYPFPYVNTMIYYDYNVYCYRLGRVGQSVSVVSLQKNINMHLKVSRALIDFYTNVKDKLDDNVKVFFLTSIAYVNCKTYEIYLSFPCRKDTKKKIQKFDNYIREKSPEIYDYFPTKTLKILAKNISLLYPFAWGWTKFKNKIGR